MKLSPGAGQVRTREQLASHIDALREDLVDHPDQWENADLASFLEAMSAWVRDMDGFYANTGRSMPAQPDWSTLAEILTAARVYE